MNPLLTLGIICLLAAIVISILFAIFEAKRHADIKCSVIFLRSLIETSELSLTAYRNIEEAFRDSEKLCGSNLAFRSLWFDFQDKFKDISPYSVHKKDMELVRESN